MARRRLAPAPPPVTYLIDTDFLIDATGGIRRAVETIARLEPEGIAVSIVTVAEFYEGAFRFLESEAVLAEFRMLLEPYRVLPVTDSVAGRFGRVRASLRRQGRLIPDMDLLIAATALEAGLTLVTRNRRHFERIPELRLHWP